MGVVISKPMLVGDTTWRSNFGSGNGVFDRKNFKRLSTKKGYFLCRSCGADIVHIDNINTGESQSAKMKSEEDVLIQSFIDAKGELVNVLRSSTAKVHEKTGKTEESSFWFELNSNVVRCPCCRQDVGWKLSRKEDATKAETDTNKEIKTDIHLGNLTVKDKDKSTETEKTVKEKELFFGLVVDKLVYGDNYLQCKCGRAVVYIESLFNYSQTGLLLNPFVVLEQLFETSMDGKAWIVTFNQAFAKRQKSTETTGTSLPGFEWAVLKCISCQEHIGWEFVPTSRSPLKKPFVGIIFDKLAITNGLSDIALSLSAEFGLKINYPEYHERKPWLQPWNSGLGRMFQHQRTGPFLELNPFIWHPDNHAKYPERMMPYSWTDPFSGLFLLKPSNSRNSPEQLVEVYTMNRKPRGICLIINNEKFAGDANDRHGSTKDAGRLSKVFECLEFKVIILKDRSGDEMINALKIIANGDHSFVDCFVCCVLTHGKLDNVSGVDQKLITIKELTENVNASRCKTLAGKPKLFFIQACQGPDHMKGVEIDSSLPEAKTETLPDARATTSEEIGKDSIPDEADFLLAFSTSAGYASYRYPDTGSVYIQILCNFLEKYALNGTLDLLSILEKVNNEVAKKNINGVLKQMPAVVDKLRMKLIFHKISE